MSRGRESLLVSSLRHRCWCSCIGRRIVVGSNGRQPFRRNNQALRKGRSPGRVLHRRACARRCCCCCCCSLLICTRYGGGLLTRFSNSTFISFSRLPAYDCLSRFVHSTAVVVSFTRSYSIAAHFSAY